tara:strand:+ start:1241 stop:1354 length:114 start_codon:yes stop_codon:yes gene_type:complete
MAEIFAILIIVYLVYLVILGFRIVFRVIDKGCDWLDL